MEISLSKHLKLFVQFLDVLFRCARSHDQIRITELVKGLLQVDLLIHLGKAFASTNYPFILLFVKLKTFEYGRVGQGSVFDNDKKFSDAGLLCLT